MSTTLAYVAIGFVLVALGETIGALAGNQQVLVWGITMGLGLVSMGIWLYEQFHEDKIRSIVREEMGKA
jgi:sulfite exporter TauE/SafE